ncbi:MAG: family 10 glycosylhydrolase, partial [Segetibacter sp.]|nr:family 10 glycosylhydrolase [Segetibacter sp.]
MRTLFICAFSIIISIQISAQPSPQFEFRAVWIATVENIDWPSKKGLPVEEQKAEYTRLLDMHKRNGMNAVVMQIRPVSDAFYPSQYEPWSEYLTGKQGLPPTPYYDPLAFMIEETHKRGMEFHAWMNPYRAVFSVTRSSVAPSHVSRLFPQWFLTYGNTKYYDPGLPQVREHVNRVVRDLVSRYDLDAIHFDDYFYPYKIPGKEFPDAASYTKYGNGMRKDDWRRSNVDTIIKMLGETIKSVNPRVKFGISQFGVWRNKDKD